jgi:hypothetical protein
MPLAAGTRKVLRVFMKFAPTPPLLAGLVLILLSAGASSAQMHPREADLLTSPSNETGFTLEMLDADQWALARHPLALGTMSRVDHDLHCPPQRGIQIELLTPGDAGLTIHFRW